MPATTRKPGPTMTALLASVVVALVLGVLGMHALVAHGVLASSTASATSVGSQVGSGGGINDAATSGASGQPTSAHSLGTAAIGHDGGHHGHSMSDMVMLCVAMLAAAAGTLLLLLLTSRRVPRVWAHLAAAPLAVPTLTNARLGTGPPSVWKFSVIRC